MTTIRQARHSRFQHGSGVFNCNTCGRSTRVTHQDNEKMCAECWDLAGETNSLSDTGELFDKNAVELLERCVERGGSAERLLREFPEVCEHIGWTGPRATPKGAITAKEWAERTAPIATHIVRVFNDAKTMNEEYAVNAATPGEAIKLAREAVKIAGISRKLGVLHFRAKKA